MTNTTKIDTLINMMENLKLSSKEKKKISKTEKPKSESLKLQLQNKLYRRRQFLKNLELGKKELDQQKKQIQRLKEIHLKKNSIPTPRKKRQIPQQKISLPKKPKAEINLLIDRVRYGSRIWKHLKAKPIDRKLLKHLGKGVQGSVDLWQSTTDKSIQWAEKIIKLEKEDIPYIKRPFDPKAWALEPYIELIVLILTGQLAAQKITPNVPMLYDYRFQTDKNKLILQTEYFNGGTLYEWLRESRRSLKSIYSMLFQLLSTIYCLQRHFKGLIHEDLHSNNILIQKVPPGGHFVYVVQGKKYYVPNTGQLFIIWDYGRTTIRGYLENWWSKDTEHRAKKLQEADQKEAFLDYARIRKVISYIRIKYDSKILQWLDETMKQGIRKRESVVDTIHNLFGQWENIVHKDSLCESDLSLLCFNKKPTNLVIRGMYNLDKPLNRNAIPRSLHNLISDV